MAGPAQGSGAAWSVTSQREDFQVGPDGRASAGVVVTFTTSSGISGSVFVPNADLAPEKVRQLVAARVETLEAIGRLTGA